ncbi:hypothetical protein [Paraglaciecola hydrolytica]|uniref:Uncharacterized protein n=1 Tax=Paraglaciecola hydrolytica TaxID=1799789 RepID=A0A148KKG1_9ALTE|nr:hypothetical protein [Paraglaciecola hydrolytica]KXI26777.1 hypothetical protein AX660_03135 [Paraglaciecola hydrolytica]
MNVRNATYTRVVNIPDHVYKEAEYRANNLPIHKMSHRKEEANGVGCLGELIAEYWMTRHQIPFTPELENTRFDYKLGAGLTIDVKTKDRRYKPKLDFDNSAPLYNHEHQRPDYFLFISLERNKNDYSKDLRRFHSAHILGSISYEELNSIGIPFLEGESDWRNGTEFWTDCLNVEMWQLIPLTETIDIFKGLINAPSSKADVNLKILKEMKFRIKNKQLKPRNLPLLNNDSV